MRHIGTNPVQATPDRPSNWRHKHKGFPPYLGRQPVLRTGATSIHALTRQRGAQLLVTSFAYYSPENYSKKAFEARELDYAENRGMPTEVWGAPDSVVTGIRAHNDVVRKLVAREKDLLFVDMEREVPKEGAYFFDICHLSEQGTERFSSMLVKAIVRPWPKQLR